jgi:hypothetical protein
MRESLYNKTFSNQGGEVFLAVYKLEPHLSLVISLSWGYDVELVFSHREAKTFQKDLVELIEGKARKVSANFCEVRDREWKFQNIEIGRNKSGARVTCRQWNSIHLNDEASRYVQCTIGINTLKELLEVLSRA